MILETFPVGWLQCNCTILGDEVTREAIVIDPGDDAKEIMAHLHRLKLTLKEVVCTHTHIDHVSAIHDLQERVNARASIHRADLALFEKLDLQAQWLGVPAPRRGSVDRLLEDGDAVSCQGVEIGAIHTPGHTPGSATFQLRADRDVLFTGDTLFRQSIGRTDLWGGSLPEIMRSIQGRLMPFGDDTLVIPGHGPSTTIGRERRENPFLR
ncbi:MAG TPA: MBL fold metallo-hydrolase [Terriglobia bacterium]|nr:MBL fold metallo-hydrolase [Terriglobia bacterium]